MRTLKAAKIAQYPINELYNVIVSPRGELLPVEFSDGVVMLEATRIIASSYYWSIVVKFPTFPLSKRYVLEGKFTAGKPNDLFNTVAWDLVDHLKETGQPCDVYDTGISKWIVKKNNDLYNDICTNSSEFYRSVDILDFMELAYSKEMLDLRCYRADKLDENPENDQKVVTEVLDKAEEVMLKGVHNRDGTLNTLCWLIGLYVIKNDQTLQSVLMRGWLIDINGEIIKHAISNSVMEGMNTVEDSSVQAREGALSIANNKTDLGRITHKGRAVTVNVLYKERVHPGDCGTKYVVQHRLVEEEFSTNIGNFFVDQEGVIRQIKATDDHLIGTTINRRTPLGCITPNPHEVCEICLGGVSDTSVKHHGLGQVKSKSFSQTGLQRTMSVKHFLKSTPVLLMALPRVARGFLAIRGTNIFIDKAIHTSKSIIITVLRKEFQGVLDVTSVSNVTCLTLDNISSITQLDIRVTKANGRKFSELIPVRQGKGSSRLSYKLLEYINANPDIIEVGEDRVEINVTKYTKSNELLVLPTKKEGLLTFYESIIRMFSRGTGNGPKKDMFNFDYPVNTAHVIYKRLLEQNPININVVELLLTCFIVEQSPPQGRKHLGCAMAAGTQHDKANLIINANSIAVKLINQSQDKTFHSFDHFSNTDRMDSSLDIMVDPEGVLGYLNNQEAKK